MPSNVASIASKRLQKMAAEVERAQRVAVERAAFEAKKAIGNEIERSTRDGRLSGVGQKGAKVGVRYDVKGTKNPTALVRAFGPLHLVENPVKPHEITPKRRGRGARKKAVVTPWGPRAKVQHPGVRTPKRPFAKGKSKAEPAVKREVERAFVGAFRRGAKR